MGAPISSHMLGCPSQLDAWNGRTLLTVLQGKHNKTNQDANHTLPGELIEKDLFSINSPSFFTKRHKI
jgi:hypothetical protein